MLRQFFSHWYVDRTRVSVCIVSGTAPVRDPDLAGFIVPCRGTLYQVSLLPDSQVGSPYHLLRSRITCAARQICLSWFNFCLYASNREMAIAFFASTANRCEMWDVAYTVPASLPGLLPASSVATPAPGHARWTKISPRHQTGYS